MNVPVQHINNIRDVKLRKVLNMELLPGSVVEIDGEEYRVKIHEEGRISLVRYDKACGMLLELSFPDKPTGREEAARKYITDMLTKQYIQRITGILEID